MAGARSCAAATAATGVDGQKLETDGWRKATVTNAGRPVATPLTIYGKGKLLILIDAASTSPICVVTAHLASVNDYPKLQAEMAADYGAPVKDKGNGEQMFIAPDHRIIDLASTGSQDKPAVRIAVGPVFQEPK